MENYYCVTALTKNGFEDYYEWGETATEAIGKVREDWQLFDSALSARKAVYAEWDCGLENYTIAGQHIPH